MAWREFWRDENYRPSRPRQAAGGIKSQSKGGSFGKTWWAKRWIEVLESFDIGARLARGRSYARRGQVLSISIDEGEVEAQVQGSRPKPYDITIQVKTLSDSDWTKVIDALGRQALFAAKLLAGEMPQDIEPVFKEVGLSLFPTKKDDLKTECSCPDWSNPCKHIAAAYYLLGEEFDRDPFLIFTLRGMDRESLTTRLAKTGKASPVASEPAAPPSRPQESLSAESETFWGKADGRTDEARGVVEVPREAAALPRRLGGFPFWQGESPFLEALTAIYAAASSKGMDVFLGPATGAERTGDEERAGHAPDSPQARPKSPQKMNKA
jgi:uncharacterized Zn finger protein